jgi:putative endonuclease
VPLAGTHHFFEMQKQPCVYMLASRPNGTLYIGVTSDLVTRVWQHKSDLIEGFTQKYSVHRLVWYEVHETMESAIAREKVLKKWERAWKIRLIMKQNPEWRDLYEELV